MITTYTAHIPADKFEHFLIDFGYLGILSHSKLWPKMKLSKKQVNGAVLFSLQVIERNEAALEVLDSAVFGQNSYMSNLGWNFTREIRGVEIQHSG